MNLDPPAFTGQQTAALLFGGAVSEYRISTIDTNPANIDNLAWVSVFGDFLFPDCPGIPCGRKVSESAVTSFGGLYADIGAESAFVSDRALGPTFTNYAFTCKSVVPEPANWAMLIAGFGRSGALLRNRRRVANAR